MQTMTRKERGLKLECLSSGGLHDWNRARGNGVFHITQRLDSDGVGDICIATQRACERSDFLDYGFSGRMVVCEADLMI